MELSPSLYGLYKPVNVLLYMILPSFPFVIDSQSKYCKCHCNGNKLKEVKNEMFCNILVLCIIEEMHDA